jgi:hypothetical protein
MSQIIIFVDWLKGSAIHQLISLVLVMVLGIFLISKYPVTFEVKTIQIEDTVQITKDIKYILRSTITKQGTNITATTSTYYTKVENTNQ